MGTEVGGVEALLCAAGYLLGMAPLLLRRDWTRDERRRRLRRYCLTYAPLFGIPVLLVLLHSIERHQPPALGAWLALLPLLGPLTVLHYRPEWLTR